MFANGYDTVAFPHGGRVASQLQEEHRVKIRPPHLQPALQSKSPRSATFVAAVYAETEAARAPRRWPPPGISGYGDSFPRNAQTKAPTLPRARTKTRYAGREEMHLECLQLCSGRRHPLRALGVIVAPWRPVLQEKLVVDHLHASSPSLSACQISIRWGGDDAAQVLTRPVRKRVNSR